MTTARESSTSKISVVDSVPVADIGRETLLRLAAASPEGSSDPVDQALVQSVQGNQGRTSNFDPATPERKYSIAIVRDSETDIAVMRGDVDAVLDAAHGHDGSRRLIRKGVDSMQRKGHRCLTVATAPVTGNDPGEFELKGYVVLGKGEHRRPVSQSRGGFTRVELWPRALRVQHWLNMALIIALTVTGYYILDPYYATPASGDTGFIMGWVRLVHYIAGASWIALAIWRLWLTVTAKTRQMHRRSLWPIYNREGLKDMWGTIQYYLFIKREEPIHIGHNALQQITYTGIYALCIVQMGTGLALWGLANQDNWFWVLMSYPVHWIGIAGIRLIHTIIMYVIWAFVVIHVYLAFRADALEDHGGVSAMINGGVWLPTGTKPVDGPEVE